MAKPRMATRLGLAATLLAATLLVATLLLLLLAVAIPAAAVRRRRADGSRPRPMALLRSCQSAT